MDIFGLQHLLIACLIFVPLERLLAIRPGQKIFRAGWRNDLIYYFLNGFLIKLGLLAIVIVVIFAADWVVPAALKAAVANQPFWLQLIEAVILSDIGFYVTHRAFHTFPFLWRFHAVHHSIEELDWLAGVRVHPVDQILTKGVSIIPVVALGFSEWTIAAYAALYQWQSILIHSNVRIGFGPLRWLFASPEFHHWHHANDRDARDKNFAGQLSILDVVFGTLHMPRGERPKSYGIDEPMPSTYVGQLLHPLKDLNRREDIHEQPHPDEAAKRPSVTSS